MAQIFLNNYATTLTQTLGDTDTTMTVASVTGLPTLAAGEFILVTLFRVSGVNESGHEVVKYTGRTGFLLTIERAIEGAAASVFVPGDHVEARLTAGALKTVGDKPVVTVTGTTQTATAGNHYVLTNVAATTVPLPATPASGDTVVVTPANDLTANVIARNGQTIMGLAEDMTLDNALATVTLRFLNNSWRLI